MKSVNLLGEENEHIKKASLPITIGMRGLSSPLLGSYPLYCFVQTRTKDGDH